MEQVISIDLGGTSLKAAMVDAAGNITRRLTLATSQEGRQAIVGQLIQTVQALNQQGGICAVGIGTPGFVDTQAGRILLAANLPGWTGTSVKQELEEALSLPIVVENDANAAAIGEAWLGAGCDLNSFLMITLGTGVGGALYHRDSGVWRGASYRGGELGHSILYPGGEPCPCGQRGCADRYVSGQALEQRYFSATGQNLRCSDIFAAALDGQQPAAKIVAQFVQDLATLLTSLKNILDPQAFIIGGGLVHWRQGWWSDLQQAFWRQCVQAASTQVLPAAAGNDAGLWGAAKLAWDVVRGRQR